MTALYLAIRSKHAWTKLIYSCIDTTQLICGRCNWLMGGLLHRIYHDGLNERSPLCVLALKCGKQRDSWHTNLFIRALDTTQCGFGFDLWCTSHFNPPISLKSHHCGWSKSLTFSFRSLFRYPTACMHNASFALESTPRKVPFPNLRYRRSL